MIVNLPPEAVAVLSKGLPIDIVDTLLLKTIDPATPNTHIKFWQEFEYAPSMTMVNFSNVITAGTDQLLKNVPDNPIPPMEKDLAFCGRTLQGHDELPIATSPNGQYALPLLKNTFAMKRVRGTVTALRAIITSPTTFTLTTTLSDLNADVLGASVHFDTVSITCPAVISAAVGTCGDTLMRCVAPTIATTGFSTDPAVFAEGLWNPILLSVAVDTLTNFFKAGVNLHFQNFAASGLTFDNLGRLKLTGTENFNCSPIPEPMPPIPPTRSLTRLAGGIGDGELIGEHGDVIPFELVPEVHVRWEWDTGVRDLLNWTRLEGASIETFGDEHNFVLPKQLRASVNVVRRFKNHCWRAPAPGPQQIFEFFDPERIVITYRDGDKNKSSRTLDEKTSGMKMRVRKIEAISAEEAAPAFEAAGGEMPECDSKSCGGWTRIIGSLPVSDILPAEGPKPVDGLSKLGEGYGPADGPTPGGGVPLEPWEVVIIVGRGLNDVVALLEPVTECGELQMFQKIVGERIFHRPSVTFYPLMMDSAEFQSEPLNGAGIRNTTTSLKFVRTHQQTSPTVDSTVIVLTEKCGYEPPAVRPASPCWSEVIDLPPRGSIAVTEGFSGTVQPRAALRDVFTNGGVQVFGTRTAAVQGLFDRGAVQVFTRVPVAYRQAGVTTELIDFRGQAYFDWDHQSNFSRPSPKSDHLDRLPRYRFQRMPYYPGWKDEELLLRYRHDAPRSMCVLPDQVFATPLTFEFEGGGLSSTKLLPATDVLTHGTRDAQLRYRVSPGMGYATGDTSRVLP